jgi:hypothetical protein
MTRNRAVFAWGASLPHTAPADSPLHFNEFEVERMKENCGSAEFFKLEAYPAGSA